MTTATAIEPMTEPSTMQIAVLNALLDDVRAELTIVQLCDRLRQHGHDERVINRFTVAFALLDLCRNALTARDESGPHPTYTLTDVGRAAIHAEQRR